MRTLLIVLCILSGVARASPVRVTVECEGEARTKACPAFLLGFIDANKVLLASPRASAEVVLYTTATEIAQVDRLHLRFVGSMKGAPDVFETDVDVDTRADDDTQRGQVEAGFLRGIALYVGSRYPALVAITLGTPDATAEVKAETSPYGVALLLGGNGNRTEKYQSYTGFTTLDVSRLDAETRVQLQLFGYGQLNRQPSLILDDGTMVPLDTHQWSVGAGVSAAYLLDDCWSLGGAARFERDDPKGQYVYSSTTKAGLEWDKYRADDPRGNRLAVLYVAGYQVDRYNLRNDIGQRFAQYSIHELIASGSVRQDKVSFGLSLAIGSELLHPARRHHVTAAPFVEWKLGGHVDLGAAFSITKRALPGPDPSEIDPTDFALISRLSYAEPLALTASLNVNIHWDRTNGARNDRFTDL